MRKLEKGQHVFIAFQNGKAVLDSQLRPRMYASLKTAERWTPTVDKENIEYVEYAPAITPKNEWVSVEEERLPESQTPVLAVLQSKTFSKYRTISVLAHIGYHEVNTEDDFGWREYEGETEYDEEKDCFWVHPCWYEVNAVDDNPNWEVDDDYEVTHWMPLPAPPKEG